MADEQEWPAYADQSILNDTDTILARTAVGAGVEIPGSALVKKNAAGHVGLGTVASAWSAGSAFQIGTWSALADAGAYGTALAFNAYYAGVWKYKTTNAASRYEQDGGHRWYIASSGTADATITFTEALRIDGSAHILAGVDNTQTLGGAAKRWSVVYAATGSINTSDEREKTWRGEITDAEYQAGLAILDDLGFYQWNDSVDEKGKDGARYHFGARAQRVWSIFADHGLAPAIGEDGFPVAGIAAPALLCFDQWEEQREPIFETIKKTRHTASQKLVAASEATDGEILYRLVEVESEEEYDEQIDTGKTCVTQEAGNRYGFRIDQLNTFLIAVMHRRQSAIEARLAALEG